MEVDYGSSMFDSVSEVGLTYTTGPLVTGEMFRRRIFFSRRPMTPY